MEFICVNKTNLTGVLPGVSISYQNFEGHYWNANAKPQCCKHFLGRPTVLVGAHSSFTAGGEDTTQIHELFDFINFATKSGKRLAGCS